MAGSFWWIAPIGRPVQAIFAEERLGLIQLKVPIPVREETVTPVFDKLSFVGPRARNARA